MMPRSGDARAAACFRVWAGALLLGAAASATSHADEGEYGSRIGVFNDCLSIRNGALQPGTPVTIIRLNSEEERFVSGDTHDRRIAGHIVGKTNSAEDCYLLTRDKSLREEEDSDDLILYIVAPVIAGGLDSIEIGIGIVGIGPDDTKPIDLDGNGAADTFSKFSSLGSLIFEVWSGAPFWGEPLWTGYYVRPRSGRRRPGLRLSVRRGDRPRPAIRSAFRSRSLAR